MNEKVLDIREVDEEANNFEAEVEELNEIEIETEEEKENG